MQNLKKKKKNYDTKVRIRKYIAQLNLRLLYVCVENYCRTLEIVRNVGLEIPRRLRKH